MGGAAANLPGTVTINSTLAQILTPGLKALLGEFNGFSHCNETQKNCLIMKGVKAFGGQVLKFRFLYNYLLNTFFCKKINKLIFFFPTKAH